ncbi:MAG: hypothetical protein GX310_09645, partial [Synergistaceae bacterium]|nr:hypothetical protein [Synergistaceae bacterium]
MRFRLFFCMMLSVLAFGVASASAEPLLRGVVMDEGQKGLPGVAISAWDGERVYRALTD